MLNNYVIGGAFFSRPSGNEPQPSQAIAGGWRSPYLLVFAASTAVAVYAKFCEERLGILWRGWLTSHLIDKYLRNRAYLRLKSRGDIDNPDQRMTEDVKSFTTITLSFLLMILNATIVRHPPSPGRGCSG